MNKILLYFAIDVVVATIIAVTWHYSQATAIGMIALAIGRADSWQRVHG